MTGRSRGPLGRGGGDAGRPLCADCGRPKHKDGARAGRQRYKCHWCRRPPAPPADADARPHCLRCRRMMNAHGPGGWLCKGCGGSCRRARTRRQYAPLLPTRAHCVRCRRPLTSARPRRLQCKRCGVNLTARPSKLHRFDVGERPACPYDGRRMAVADGGRFTCCRCRTLRRRLRRHPDEAAALLSRVSRALPAYLTPDEREDAAQQIMLDVLAGRLAPYVPSPAALRRYARGARAMTSDAFKFISLSASTSDGREFGETLAA